MTVTIVRGDLPKFEIHSLDHWPRTALTRELLELAATACSFKSTTKSRAQFFEDLTYGFVAFSVQKPGDVPQTLSGLSRAQATAFTDWLQAFTTSTGKALAYATKSHRLAALKAVLDSLHGADATRVKRQLFRAEPFGKPANADPKIMDERSYAQWVSRLVEATTKLVVSTNERLDRVDAAVKASEPAHAGPEHCLARLLDVYPGGIPERKVLVQRDSICSPQLQSALDHCGYKDVLRGLAPTPRELTLLVYFLATFTLLNEQPLLGLKTVEVQENSILGGRMMLSPVKNRAHMRLRLAFADDGDPASPVAVIRLLKRWTSRIRAWSPAAISEDLFLYLPRNRPSGSEVRSFSSRDPAGLKDFKNGQSDLAREFELPWAGLRVFRTTGAELLNSVTDVTVVAAMLGHSEVDTAHKNYVGVSGKRVESVALAGAMAQRERYLASNGVVDSRRDTTRPEKSAATPGFTCLDPLDSPIPGQRRGRPCTAYPMCPVCPLAQPAPDRAIALRRFLDLRDALLAAEESLGLRQWRARYGSVYVALLTKWIPLLDNEPTRDVALALRFSPLPPIE